MRLLSIFGLTDNKATISEALNKSLQAYVENHDQYTLAKGSRGEDAFILVHEDKEILHGDQDIKFKVTGNSVLISFARPAFWGEQEFVEYDNQSAIFLASEKERENIMDYFETQFHDDLQRTVDVNTKSRADNHLKTQVAFDCRARVPFVG